MFMSLAYRMVNSEIRKLIDEDIYRYLKWDHVNDKSSIKRLKLCLKKRDFIPVFLYRMKNANIVARVLARVGSLFITSYNTVEISGNIQGGLLISHSFSIVMPKSAGKNLRVGPGVVIGRTGAGFPVIGNNVYIAANSTVIGAITIGDNVIVGAGTVVTKDIPDNSVVVGNPARVIRQVSEKDFNEIR